MSIKKVVAMLCINVLVLTGIVGCGNRVENERKYRLKYDEPVLNDYNFGQELSKKR